MLNRTLACWLTAMAATCLSSDVAPAAPKTLWTWNLPARKVAWEFNGDMPRDALYVPVVQGNLVLVGCEHNGALLALDLDTGAERWRFYTNGPIRTAPVADAERVHVASDDGHLYCLDHAGKLVWKFRGGSSNRQVLAHERIASAWPASAQPILADGKIYYTAGHWPVDGVFVHAVDARTGQAAWTSGAAQYRPTGALRIVDGTLFVNGFHGSGAYNAANGAVVTAKPPPAEKAPMPELPGRRKISVTPAGQISLEAEGNGDGKSFGNAASPAGNTKLADEILAAAKVRDGYCIVAGLEDGALVEGLLQRSKLYVIAIDPDAGRVDKVRRRLDAAGLFDDHRLSVLTEDPACLPPYIASLITTERDQSLPEALRRSQRPHGGAWVERKGGAVRATHRQGMPEGAAEWTHEFCDAANTLAVRDKLVKAPLGTLWYGGPETSSKYYFHGKDTQPVSAEVIDGRLILQGQGVLAAFDIYTGRLFWESPLPRFYVFGGLGIHSKDNPHPMKVAEALKFDIPPSERSRATGFDMVSTSDGVYLSVGKNLLRFDPTDGKRVSEWPVPLDEKGLCWGNLRLVGKTLIATAFRPQDLIDADAGFDGNGGEWAGDRMPMAYLLALDRDSGKLLWSRKAAWGFLNRGGVALGADKVFCIDLLLENAFDKLKEAGRKFPDTPPMLYALNLKSGAVEWSQPLGYRPKGVVYSAKRDILVVPCRNKIEWKDGAWVNSKKAKLADALKGNMRGIQGADGKVLWEVSEEPYNDPPLLLDDLIVSRQGLTFDLRTGKRHQRTSPLTGQPEQWSFSKAGCNYIIGCDNLFTWRTGFFDVEGGTGSMPLSGMEAGCTPTLIPSGGVLNIPNLGNGHLRARMVAMALVHVPENPFWAVNPPQTEKNLPSAPIVHAGYNFGAQGLRKADDGTVWLPVNKRTNSGVTVKGTSVDWFELHPARTGDWKASAGVLGAAEITVPTWTSSGKKTADASNKRRYDVRLTFVEPAAAKPGERVFSVSLEGNVVLQDFDLARESGTQGRVTRVFQDVEVSGPLDIRLTPKTGTSVLSAVELIGR